MADLTISMRRDPSTGKNQIFIKLDSEPDAMPLEHENLHKALVEKLIGRKLEDNEEIVVERPAEPVTAGPAEEPCAPVREPARNKR